MKATTVVPIGAGQAANAVSSAASNSPIESLISLGITQTQAQAAYVYAFDSQKPGFALIASLGPKRSFREVEVAEISQAVSAFHASRQTAIVLHDRAWADWRFADFPEFREGRFETVVSLPLIDATSVVGLVHFCRAPSAPVRPADLSFLIELSRPIAALVVASAIQEQLQRTNQLLADRKLLDRAKGMIQAEFGWTEEQAYMHIRRLSRQQRTPMRDIARRVIQSSKDRLEASA